MSVYRALEFVKGFTEYKSFLSKTLEEFAFAGASKINYDFPACPNNAQLILPEHEDLEIYFIAKGLVAVASDFKPSLVAADDCNNIDYFFRKYCLRRLRRRCSTRRGGTSC